MNRRNFIKSSSLAGLAVSSAAITACAAKESMPVQAVPDFTFELDEVTIDALQQKMGEGIYTARAITEMYLSRIEAIDKNGPGINAVIELNPDALSIADAMDKERREGKVRSALHGIPVLIKDNIDTADKMKTTAGSLALADNVATTDAAIVKKLREAGAVILGKTNLSEFANFRSTSSSSGWSSRGGQTKNPVALNRNPCGSSSGSGAAVAANLCAVAVGTETDGSVIAPASFCGIVGIKPTVGVASRSGIIPISSTQDTAGPMARTVKDAAILLQAIHGADPDDFATMDPKNSNLNFVQFLDADFLKGKNIGFEKSFLSGNAGVVKLYLEAKAALIAAGANVIEVDLLSETGSLGDAEFTLMQYEFKDGLNRYLQNAHSEMKSLEQIIAFNKRNAETVMPYFQQEILEMSAARGSLDEQEYKNACATTVQSKKMIDDLMAKFQLDAICGTSIGVANCTDLVNGDYYTGFYFCPPAAMAGYPHISVPMGKVHGLPVGLSFMGGAWKDAEVIGLAYAFEQQTQLREKPMFIAAI